MRECRRIVRLLSYCPIFDRLLAPYPRDTFTENEEDVGW